jgi:hypothetical protein
VGTAGCGKKSKDEKGEVEPAPTAVDECADGSHNCDGNATCTDTAESFTCACNAGYTGDGTSCTSTNTAVDECAAGTHNCDSNATCTDTTESFTCACNAGYSGDGTSCSSGSRIGTTPCGSQDEDGNYPGVYVQELNGETWTDSTLCLMSGDREYDELHFGAGYGPAEWDYEQAAFPASGMYGWSYYLRAFDLIRDTPVHELGWGQWSKPSGPADGVAVCGLHPHGFVCDEDPPTVEEMAGEVQNCGHVGYEELEDCAVWCCGEEDKCGVRGSIEGGMGYWMYTLETPHVKWMLPGATNANYEIFGGTFLGDGPQACTTLGGAVRVANNFLVPNDMVSFEDDDVNGFLGYMLSRTPIGKRSVTDDANYWTIIIDAENFAGPVMYMSSWFWDSRINWHPESVSWSDPRALLGYVAQGFEGRIGGIQVVDSNGVQWRRTNRWAFPKDVSNGVATNSSTLFTGHSQYNTDWAVEAMEPMLAGTGSVADRTPDGIKTKSLAHGQIPGHGCNLPDEGNTALGMSLEEDEDEDEIEWEDFGVSGGETTAAALAASEAANCHVKLSLDTSKLDCSTTDGWCEGHRYIKVNSDGTSPTVVAAADVAADVKAALDLRAFESTRKNDGRFLGPPAQSEEACFNNPGPAPADPRLYCTRTKSGNWIGFRWYRFVDQPEMNQVFASLPAGERDTAKCFMQARIERLHEAQQGAAGVPRWFDLPQGADALPGAKVKIDVALLVTPPIGLEKGFVPISVYERKRTKPDDCDVTLGDNQSEPNPLAAGYYDGYAGGENSYEIEMCPANAESNGETFSYPGILYPYSPGEQQGTARDAYAVPIRDQVAAGLSATPVVCGLASDAPGP